MSRTENALLMLQELMSRSQVISSAELAAILETNPRNIREYKKELQNAGYDIEEIRGPRGGYKLVNHTWLPGRKRLSDQQLSALLEAREYLDATNDFQYKKVFHELASAIAASAWNVPEVRRYQRLLGSDLSPRLIEFLKICEEGKRQGRMVQVTYQSTDAKAPAVYDMDPYEIVHYDKNYYLVGYSHLRNDFRNLRFSTGRMLDVKLTDKPFWPDPDFRLQDHIGENFIFKGEKWNYRVRVEKDYERFFLEESWGEKFERVKEEGDWCWYTFTSVKAR